MHKLIISISILLSTNLSLFGQVYPQIGPVFLQNEVATIKIQIHPDSLSWILQQENWSSNHEFPATFIYQSSILTDTVYDIGFRLRGNTSRSAAKKSFKVSFNSFESRKWQGFEKLNLNGQQNDVSLLRTKLCWEMMREAGLPAARTSYIALYINEEYKGLYLNTEHIDENFAATYFDNQGDGDLYKCLYPANLQYLGSDPNNYKLEVFGRRVYQLKTNTWLDNYSTIRNFISLIDEDFNENEICEISESFNVDRYIQYLALEILQGHWDGYVFNNNNFYLYFNDATQTMEWIPYDLDNTLGIDWFGENWTNRDIYHWKPGGQSRPLYSFIMNNPALREKFSFYIHHFIDQYYQGDWLADKVESYQNLISSYVQDDVYYTLDYGFEHDDFINADNSAWGGHIAFGLNSYFFNRKLAALSSLETFAESIGISDVIDNGPQTSSLSVSATITHASEVSLEYVIDDTPVYVLLTDDGVFPDLAANDNRYHFIIEIPNGSSFVDYRFHALSNSTNDNYYFPCDGYRRAWTSSPESHLQINEVMANNTDTYLDESGEAEDWIELFNGTSSNVNLSSYYFTDEYGNWNKWKLPSVIQQVGTFRVWWADNEPEVNSFHTNFRLSNGSETLWLIKYENGAPRIMDAIAIEQCPPNQSFGRENENSDQWIIFPTPTPNLPNSIVNIQEIESESFYIYPNPTHGFVRLSSIQDVVEILDLNGRLVEKHRNVSNLDLRKLSNGVYILRTPNESIRLVIAR